MGAVLTILAYLFQTACTLLLAGAACALLMLFLRLLKIKCLQRHKAAAYFVCLAVLCGGLTYLSRHPLICCRMELKERLTPELKEEMSGIASGIYSKELPLIPLYVRLEEIENDKAVIKTQYLYFGSVIYELGDGIAVTKRLFG